MCLYITIKRKWRHTQIMYGPIYETFRKLVLTRYLIGYWRQRFRNEHLAKNEHVADTP